LIHAFRSRAARWALGLLVWASLLTPPVVSLGQDAPRHYRAAILADSTLPISGAPTPPTTFIRAFGAEGIPVTSLDAAQLADPAVFNRSNFDLLIVPTGAVFPIEARQTLLSFLKAGGDLLTCGGYAFDGLVTRSGKGWVFQQDRIHTAMVAARDVRKSLVANGNFQRGLEGWQISAPDACTITDQGPTAGVRAALSQQSSPTGGAVWTYQLPVEAGQRYLIGAVARADGVAGDGFGFLAVYQYDATGRLVTWQDFAHLIGTSQQWARYETLIAVAPDAKRVEFHAGLYRAAGRFRFSDVTCAEVPQEIRINAHYGKPEDGLQIEPEQLTIFSPDQPIAGASLVAAPGSGIGQDWKEIGKVTGVEATAQLRQSGRWRPLVNVLDRFGRFVGTAVSMVTWNSGIFKGGTWVLSGVTNRDVFSGERGEYLLGRIGRLLALGVHLEAITTDEATYHAGETVHIFAECANRCRTARSGDLQIRLIGRSAEGRAMELAGFQRHLEMEPGARDRQEFTWKVPGNAPDFVEVQVACHCSGAGNEAPTPVDAADTGFCVYSPSVVRAGPNIAFRENAFYLGSAQSPQVLFGTDTYANMFQSPSQSPLTWFRDLALMRDYGLHVFENLQYTPPDYRFTPKQWRQIDGLIQLAQRFGLVYMAGLLIGQNVVVDDDTLHKQEQFCAEFARRYRDVPGLIYYLNGDFQLHLQDTPFLRRLWNGFLRQRYGSDAALRAAWGPEAPHEPLGSIPVSAHAALNWQDARARDTAEFEGYLVRRWVSSLTRTIRAVDPDHPITAEYYQRPWGGIDLRLTIDGLDAANIGYFGPPERDEAMLPSTIKWNDMSSVGKGINIGEFGVKTHDAWVPERGGSGYHIRRTPRQQDELFWWVVHAALAFGVSKIQNWCWADDPDGVFPWGVVWNNPIRPKPVLKLYRNLSVLAGVAGLVPQRANVALVVADALRMGAPQEAAWPALMNAVQCLLGTGVPFDVVNQQDLVRLAARPPKAVFLPLAGSLTLADWKCLVGLARRGTRVYVSAPPGGGAWFPERMLGAGVPLRWPWPVRRIRVGKGAVFRCSIPWELMQGSDLFGVDAGIAVDPSRNLYLRVVRQMGLRPVRPNRCLGVVRQDGSRRLFAVFPVGGQANRTMGLSAASVSAGSVRCSWRPVPTWPCLALVEDRSKVLAATGDGALAVNGRPIVWGHGPWMLAALDGRSLTSSKMLVAATQGGERVRFRSANPRLKAFAVEWNKGQLRRLAPVDLQFEDGAYTVLVPDGELVLLTDGGGSPADVLPRGTSR